MIDDTTHEIKINLKVMNLKTSNIAKLAAFEIENIGENRINCKILFEMGICTLEDLIEIIPIGSWTQS